MVHEYQFKNLIGRKQTDKTMAIKNKTNRDTNYSTQDITYIQKTKD